MPTLEAIIPQAVAREVANAVNRVPGFRATVEIPSRFYATATVRGPIRHAGLTPDRYSLSISVDAEYISLFLTPGVLFQEELQSPMEAMNALDDDLAHAVGNRFELVAPDCFDRLAEALIGLGLFGLPVIGATDESPTGAIDSANKLSTRLEVECKSRHDAPCR